MTAVRDPDAAWDVLVEDALTAVALVRELAPAEAVDVGSGGGSPGIPIAIALGIPVTLLEATGTKCRFLERAAAALEVPLHRRPRPVGGLRPGRGPRPASPGAGPCARPAAGRGRAVLPLVAVGGAAILWTGAEVDADALARTAGLVGGSVEASHSVDASRRLVVLRKHDATPERFPRRPGIARARPLVPVPSSQYELPRLRACEPERRRRKDHDRDQHGRVRRRGGHTRAPDRPRSAGQRHDRPGIPARRARCEHL